MPTKLLVFFILILSLPSSSADEYCLSGGFNSDFSCDKPQQKIDTSKYFSLKELKTCLKQNQANPYICYQDQTNDSQASTVSFSVQLLEQQNETSLSQHQDVLHISELADKKKLVYIGSYKDKTTALTALDEAAANWGEVHKPILVEFSPTQGLPKIRLIAEADYSNIAPTEPSSTPQSLSANTAKNPTISKVYALQMGAYGAKSDAIKFAKRYQELNPVCRRKDNGLYVVYHSTYADREEAITVLQSNSTLKKLGVYATSLKNVQFKQCVLWTDSAAITNTQPPEPVQNLVFSIQTAAFNNVSGSNIFIKRHQDINLACRKKSNGMFAVYYGQFGNYDEAKRHLADKSIFKKLGAYVVKLPNVEFNNCKTTR